MRWHAECWMHTFLVVLHMHHRICIKLAHGLLRHEMRILFLVTTSLGFLLWITVLFLSSIDIVLFLFFCIWFSLCLWLGFTNLLLWN